MGKPISAETAAKMIGHSYGFVRRLIRAGVLKTTMYEGKKFVDEDSVNEYIETVNTIKKLQAKVKGEHFECSLA